MERSICQAGRGNTEGGWALVQDVTDIYDVALKALGGGPLDAGTFRGKATLIVNVASRCGLTPQYEGLEQLHERYKERGFTVLGAPCNQFGQQEPGTPEEIATFCSTTYGVSFPLTEKLDVNGPGRHPLYDQLTAVRDAAGEAGDVEWNFEKFLVSPEGEVVARFRPQVTPGSDEVRLAIEASLPT
jgi:glutathione peroxidase